MSEIKVGDFCKVSGWCWQYYERSNYNFYNSDYLSDSITDMTLSDDLKAKVIRIDEIFILIEFDTTKKAACFLHGQYVVHRKQCRKLVKIKKCYKCEGSGNCNYCTPEDTTCSAYYHYPGLFGKCIKCNGSGKMKTHG